MSPDLAPHPVSASDKVAAHHLDRLAVVYVRQSTLQQIEHHRESTQLQYGLADRACRLGWPRPKVMVIDEYLGLSAASTEGRTGFQRLVPRLASATSAWCSASRSRAWPAPVATGTSSSRSARSPEH
jgi:hypothetical protein